LWPEKETEQRKNTLRFQVDEEELFMKTAWAIEEPSGFQQHAPHVGLEGNLKTWARSTVENTGLFIKVNRKNGLE
jgi:hypothetical protein